MSHTAISVSTQTMCDDDRVVTMTEAKESDTSQIKVGEVIDKLLVFKESISIEEFKDLDIACRSLIKKLLDGTTPIDPGAVCKLQGILDYVYEKINIGNWKNVFLYLRKTMNVASYLKLLCMLKYYEDGEMNEYLIVESFKIIDYGLLFGCPLEKELNLLQKCASVLIEVKDIINTVIPLPDSAKADDEDPVDPALYKKLESISEKGTHIPVVSRPTLQDFASNFLYDGNPVILVDCMSHWPALTKWKDTNYLLKLAAARTIPVELGTKYTDSDWSQTLMTFEDFIQNHILENNPVTGYLAQYHLFEHIPELKRDISQPDYSCYAATSDPVEVNAWYGPKGTVSPLHYDNKNNLLCQVVGAKSIYLFPPGDTKYLYPHQNDMLDNTAKVDPRDPDLDNYPRYKNATMHHCVLKPGEMLFIPPNWWHFVESLSVSFSVSYWWN